MNTTKKITGIEAAAQELSKFIKDCDGCDAYSESYLVLIIAKHCVGKETTFQLTHELRFLKEQREDWSKERNKLLAACVEYRDLLDKAYAKAARLECAAMNLATDADQLACDLNPNKAQQIAYNA